MEDRFSIAGERPQPPHNNEAEQALLGALLANNRAFDRVSEIVRPEDFYDGVHGRIFAAIGKVLDRGEQASPVTLKNLFDQDGALSEIGGATYLARLAAAVVTIINAEDYATTIADLSLRRRIMEAMDDGIVDASVIDLDHPADAVLEDIESRLAQIGERDAEKGVRHVASVADSLLEQLNEAFKRGAAGGVTTGLADLDKTLGGLHAGDLLIVGGRPGMGKTALIGTVALAAARAFQAEAAAHPGDKSKRKSVAVFELEMTAEQLTGRLFADLTGISAERQRQGDLTQADFDALMTARDELAALPLHVDDSTGITLARIRQRARRIKRRHGLGLLIVDYLQLVRGANARDDMRIRIGEIANGLKALAKELDVPVIALSQLSRAVDQREDKRPVMGDLKESGDIEAAADSIVFLYRHEYYLLKQEPLQREGENPAAHQERMNLWLDQCVASRNKALAIIGKNRHGKAPMEVSLFFNGARSRFENLAQPSFEGMTR
jgi:replicative DNA helicase